MRKIKEVLRLHFELEMGQREIARACAISQSTVHDYLKAAKAAGVSWPLLEGWDESRLETAIFGDTLPVERKPQHAAPDFRSLQDQLQRHPHLTLQLAWEPAQKRGNSTIGQMLVLVGRRTCKSGSAKTGGLRPARASFVSASNQLQNGDHREQNFVFKAQKSLSASPCIPDMRLQAYEHTGLAGIFRVGFRVCGSGHHAS